MSVENSRDLAMPAPISMDLRLRIVRAVERGSSIRAAARRFAVSPSAAIKLMQRVRTTGSAAPARYGGQRRPLLEPRGRPQAAVGSEPRHHARRATDGAAAPLGRRRRAHDPAQHSPPPRPQAQKKSVRAAEQDRPDVAHKRRLWRAWRRFMDPARFVFLDETGTATNMARRYGRSPGGARLVAAVPHGHWHTTTFIAGLKQSGIVAPLVLAGPM